MDAGETLESKINRSEYKILIVDDVVSNVLLLKILLTNEKFQVCTANNGTTAIDQARKEHPDTQKETLTHIFHRTKRNALPAIIREARFAYSQLSTINSPLSTFHYQLSTVHPTTHDSGTRVSISNFTPTLTTLRPSV